MTPRDRQIGILRHALGTGDDSRKQAYRNHFVTGEGSDDYADCMALVDGGLMARRAGSELTGGNDLFMVTEAGKRVSAPADPWKAAVIDALVTAHIYTAAHESDPRGALNALLAYEQDVALDPAVSLDAAALIERGRADAGACVAALRRIVDRDADARAALRAYDERSGA